MSTLPVEAGTTWAYYRRYRPKGDGDVIAHPVVGLANVLDDHRFLPVVNDSHGDVVVEGRAPGVEGYIGTFAGPPSNSELRVAWLIARQAFENLPVDGCDLTGAREELERLVADMRSTAEPSGPSALALKHFASRLAVIIDMAERPCEP
jgi:hypothetical protein